MNYYAFDFSEEIPNPIRQNKMPEFKNAWVSPNGDFYGMEGARHLIAATYLCVYDLGIYKEDLNKGTYFSENFDGRLLALGWLEIKDSSWISDAYQTSSTYPPKFIIKKEPTQAQQNIVFDYCEKHDLDYPFKEEN